MSGAMLKFTEEKVYTHSMRLGNNIIKDIRQWADDAGIDIKFSFMYVYFKQKQDATAYILKFGSKL